MTVAVRVARVDQRHLAEVVTGLQDPALDPVDEHRRLAGVDHEERRRARALLDHRFTLREAPLLEDARDPRELALVEVGEERDALEHVDRARRSSVHRRRSDGRVAEGRRSARHAPALVTALHCSR